MEKSDELTDHNLLKACEESAQQARPSLDGNKILPTYPQIKQSKIRGSLLEVVGGWGDF